MSEEAISVRMLRNDVSAILRRVEAGETFAVTRHGSPVARIGPIDRERRTPTMAEFRELFAGTKPDREWIAQIRTDRDLDHVEDPYER